MQIKSYRDLIVWQKSIELVTAAYELTELFPKSEIYGLTTQMRRAAISIPSNIAEGSRRGTRKDFRHFVLIAFGSASELETQLIIVKLLPWGKELNCTHTENLLTEVLKMLNRMISSLENS